MGDSDDELTILVDDESLLTSFEASPTDKHANETDNEYARLGFSFLTRDTNRRVSRTTNALTR